MATKTTMLQLPRELYLDICSYLTPGELIKLTGVSRDHYLAVQQPLFSKVRISSYRALVRLVETLMKAPVVSHITPHQRKHWYKLSDAQLRERDIQRLELLLNSDKDGQRVTGVVLARCIGAIARKCDAMKISMTLNGSWPNISKQLDGLTLPSVTKLTLFLGPTPTEPLAIKDVKSNVWTLAFSGSTFPDLKSVYMNTLMGSAEDLPTNMEDGFLAAEQFRRRRFSESSSTGESGPFYGLFNMQEIKLEYNTILDGRVLKSLFGSSVIPKRLTKLDIVNCPGLHPIKDLEALATLLQRGLQLLQSLKIHLRPQFLASHYESYEMAYNSKINEHPERHLCNIVRVLGQEIKSLDLALPFACNRMLLPAKTSQLTHKERPELPQFPAEPVNTLPDRLTAAGFRYRRLIFNGICKDAHSWEEMAEMAGDQGDKVSWELMYDAGYSSKGIWLMSGCAPVEFSVKAAMQRPFVEIEN